MAKFLVDECVPQSVIDFLNTTDHEVFLVKDVLMQGTQDQVVAKVAEEQQSIIVTWNVKDFRKEIRRHKFGVLGFKCPEPEGANLLMRDFYMIEAELSQVITDERRFWVEIRKSGIKFHREDYNQGGD